MSIKLNGATSGSVDIDVPAVVGGDVSLVLPGGGTADRLERAGNVIQVVHTVDSAYAAWSTTVPIDNTIPQSTEGTEFMSLAITPTSATNKLLITVNAVLATSNADWIIGALFQDSGTDAIAAWTSYQGTPGGSANCNFSHYMTAGTTSETTFKFRAGQSLAGTTHFNGNPSGGFFNGTCVSTITITEIAA